MRQTESTAIIMTRIAMNAPRTMHIITGRDKLVALSDTNGGNVVTHVGLEVVVEETCPVVLSVSAGVSLVDSVGVSMEDSVGVSMEDSVGVSVVEMVVDSVLFTVKQFFG